ncbi:TonB-dependent receptor [Paremcibacter congregatus]|uniref:TonB-dependent receptor n=1 Tax=Paremcibacter congregatus TaxID=2043170 RepID=UPI0030EC8955|tara:strand:- start:2423 stop:5425 length:3003 start_codon:yes stop_codon:yes gene_type:complete
MFTNSVKSRLLLGAAVSALMLGSAVTTATAEDYTTGTLSGTVQNEAGTKLAGAIITLVNKQGAKRTIVTDENGSYRAPALSIGEYTATIEMAGHETLTGQKLNISIGSAGEITFTLDSQDSTMEEVFVVGTRQAGYDFNSTTTGLSVSVDEVFSRTPIARDSTSIALLAPGTSEGDSAFEGGNRSRLASIGGSSVAENVYYVNGMNITNFRTFVGGSTLPFEFYEQVEVKTGGYQAEFGRSTGGVINAVTKSGTNEFSGGANVFWEGNALRETTPDTYSNANRFDRDENVDANFYLSGPVIEDRLFFFAMYNPRNNTQTDYTKSQKFVETKNDPFWGVKFDLNLFEGHKLEATIFSDDQSAETVNYAFNPDNKDIADVDAEKDLGEKIGTSTDKSGGTNKIFKYTGVLADWVTISGLYGENSFSRSVTSDVDANPAIYASAGFRGYTSLTQLGNWSNFRVETGFDERKAYRIDADFYFEALGDHHIRMGWDREDLTAVNETINSGGVYYRYRTAGSSDTHGFAAGEEYVVVREYANGGTFNTTQSALYIQDSWQALENLTLNIGVRNETFKNKNGNGEKYIEVKNQVAWRAGATWDPMNDGANRIYGNWGRYYLPIATNTSIRQASAETYIQRYYHLDGINPTDDTPIYDNTATPEDIEVFGDGTINSPAEILDINIKPMYQDEFILGYEHDFGNGWQVGIRGIYRKLGRMIEDVAIDKAVEAWGVENGYDAAQIQSFWSGFHQYVLTNPGSGMTVSLAKEGLTGNAADEGEFVVADLTAAQLRYPKGKRTYKALEFTFAREWDGQWSLEGSYTMSFSKGNTEGSVKSDNGQDDAGITTDFDQPGLVDGSYGWLPNDRRHKFKVWGAYAVTDWMTVGAKFDLASPRKFGCIGYHPTDDFAQAYGAASWYCNSVPTPRGESFDSDWVKTLDLSASIIPSFSDSIPGDIVMRIDVFNVFNSHAVRDYREIGETGLNQPDPNYGKPTGFQSPRRIRLSASYKF